MDFVSPDLIITDLQLLIITCNIPAVLVYRELHPVYTTASPRGLEADQKRGRTQRDDYINEAHRSEVGVPVPDGFGRAASTCARCRIDDLGVMRS